MPLYSALGTGALVGAGRVNDDSLEMRKMRTYIYGGVGSIMKAFECDACGFLYRRKPQVMEIPSEVDAGKVRAIKVTAHTGHNKPDLCSNCLCNFSKSLVVHYSNQEDYVL